MLKALVQKQMQTKPNQRKVQDATLNCREKIIQLHVSKGKKNLLTNNPAFTPVTNTNK